MKERLTEKIEEGILVKEDYGDKVLKTLYVCNGTEPTPHYTNCEEGYCVMEKLLNYEKLEENGHLLQLPCIIGDTVFEVQEIRKRIQPMIITAIHIEHNNSLFFDWKLKNSEGVYQNIKGFSNYQIGRDVFLTREEAEEKLKKYE